MQSSARKIQFDPRKNLQRTLKYPRHLKLTYCCLAILVGYAWIILLTPTKYIEKGISSQALPELVVMSFLSILILREAIMAFSVVEVFSDRLELTRMGKRIQIPYSEITDVRFSPIEYLAGSFKVEAKGKKYKFLILLERGEYILEAISAVNSQLIPLKKLESYRVAFVASNHCWAHLNRKLIPKKYWLIKYLLVPGAGILALAMASSLMQKEITVRNLETLAYFTFGAQLVLATLFGIIVSVALFVRIRVALNADPNDLGRDLKIEDRFEGVSQKVQMALVIGFFLWLLSLTFFGS